MTKKNRKLYFVALVPTGLVLEKAQLLKKEVLEKFGSKAALNSPPHITLHMPFHYREDREESLINNLSTFSSKQKPFAVSHQGFGAFAPRVIFIKVDLSDSLKEMRENLIKMMRVQLKIENADYKNRAFHPHMTIAFRDLKKAEFAKAWVYFDSQEFLYSWDCTDLVLLKHNGDFWEIYQRFPFSAKN